MKPSDSSPKPGNRTGKENDKQELSLSALKTTDYSSSFDEVGQWMYEVNNQKAATSLRVANNLKERKLQKMKRYFLANKLRFAYPVIALVLLIAACSMPVTQHENMGSAMSWTVDKTNPTVQDEISSLGWINKTQLNVNENTNNGKTEVLYTLMLPNASKEQINGYQKQLEKINGVTSIKVYPIGSDIKRPLYSAALNTFFRVNIDGSTLNDKELKEQVVKQFKDAGMDNCPELNITTDANGKRQVMMKINNDGKNKDPKNFELNINDGNNVEKMKVIHRDKSDMDKFKGKSDDEIRKMVKEEFDNPDIKDSDIKIIRENGDVKVKIEVSKEETGPKK